MKGKLLTPIKYIKNNKNLLEEIVEAFAKQGHKLESKVLETPLESTKQASDSALKGTYQKIQSEIKSVDFIVAEISEPSSGIGFFLGQAVLERKPVLALVRKESNEKGPLPLKASKNKFVSYKEYNPDEGFDEIVKEFVNNAKQNMDSKFILIISPEIDKYLAWAADERRMHKAQIVRNAVEKTLEKDSEYQVYQKKEF